MKKRKPGTSPLHSRRLFAPHATKKTGEISLTGKDRHYLCNVLRMTTGDRLVLFDGRGWEYSCVLAEINPTSVRISILEKQKGTREPPIEIHLGVGLLKAQKMDLAVQKAVELGVHGIFPVATSRAVKVLDPARAAARKTRWQKIAQEASRQCGRSHVTEIHAVMTLEAFTDRSSHADLCLLFTSQVPEPLEVRARQITGRPGCILALTGPEGGFSQEEEQMAREKGFLPTGLGPRILRAETAAILAVGLLQYRFGDLGGRGT